MDDSLMENAARNLIARLGVPVRGPVVIICSEGKEHLGFAIVAGLMSRGIAIDLIVLRQASLPSELARAAGCARSAAENGSLILLIEPEHAAWLFATAGRPDAGLLLPAEHLYCDWLLGYPGLLRTLQADYALLTAWRRRLLKSLTGARMIHLTTLAGTDLTFQVGTWKALDGEVCAVPCPGGLSGRLVVDGALYEGLPSQPLNLDIADGRIANLETLSSADPRQRMLYADLTRDAGASLVAEFGLGINPCVRHDAEIMEAETARGSAHVGLGENRFLGGSIKSATHVDVGLLRPTLCADKRIVSTAGQYHF